jgi:hypothetical protein
MGAAVASWSNVDPVMSNCSYGAKPSLPEAADMTEPKATKDMQSSLLLVQVMFGASFCKPTLLLP